MGYQEEKQILAKIVQFLDRMGVPYKFQDIGEKDKEIFPAVVCTFRYQNSIDFDVIVYTIGKWIHVKCLVLKTDDLKLQMRAQLYELSLQLNYDLPEVTFSANNGDIYIEMDALIDTTFEDFASEFNSISEGIGVFIQSVREDLKIEIVSTKGHEHKGVRRKRSFRHK